MASWHDRHLHFKRLAPKRRTPAAAHRRSRFESLEQRAMLAGESPLLLLGVDAGSVSSTNAGLVLVADLDAQTIGPLRADLSNNAVGWTGMAFAPGGQLYATTGAGPGSTSHLVALDPATGAELSRVAVAAAGQGVSVGDLAQRPGTGDLYAIRSADDGRGLAGSLYRVNPQTGVATLVGDTGLGVDGGLAFAPDGTLYLTSRTGSATPMLHTLDAATAQVLTSVNLTDGNGSSGAPLAGVQGLAVSPDGALVGTDSATGRLIAIDPATGMRTLAAPSSLDRGVFGDLDFRPATPGVELTQVYYEDFEDGVGGFTADNTGGTRPGYWHYSIGRYADGLINHTPRRSFYYGRFETSTGGGSYDTFLDHQGVLFSPEVQIPAGGVSIVSFNYLLETRDPLDVDFVDVSVDNGTTVTQILARNTGTLPQTGRQQWLTATADLTDFAGQTIRLLFSFDTGGPIPIDPEGWYVDDVLILNISDPQIADIAGFKWDDQDGDGVWDPGEPGLNGWVIYVDGVHGPDNGQLDWADGNGNGTWDSGEGEQWIATANDGVNDGAFALFGLGAGTFSVREVSQPGWKPTFPPAAGTPTLEHVVTVDPASGARVLGQFETTEAPNFGNGLPDISGYKWDDQNGDGVWDASEPGLNGWTIYLDLDDSNDLSAGDASVVTGNDGANDGSFSFFGLPAGTYTVREVVPEDWKQRYPGATEFEHTVTIDPAAGIRVHGLFAIAQPPNFGNGVPDISGYKWDDQNGDGVWDAGEPGLNGWTIFLDGDGDDSLDWTDGNSNGQWDAGEGEQWTVTAFDGVNDGVYAFFGLAAGTYAVREVPQTAWQATFPAAAGVPLLEHGVTIDPAAGIRVNGQFATAEAPNFGNGLPDISGYKWDDQDGDGLWDAGEPGLNGWTIYVDLDDSGTLTAADLSMVTQNNGVHDGAYWFFNVPDGTHAVREVLQANWKQTFPGPPGLEHLVTVNAAAGIRENGAFEQTESPNFGNVLPDVSGYKWDDENGDGVWDAGEPGLNGWTIYIDADGSGNLSAGDPSFVTQNDGVNDGAYWFVGLGAGDHTLREVVQTDWIQTFPDGSATPPLAHTVSIDPPAGTRVHGQFATTDAPNFGNALPDISGFVWQEAAAATTGMWDAGVEFGISGVTVFLDGTFGAADDTLNWTDDNSNGAWDPGEGEPWVVTQDFGNGDGEYRFFGLADGTHTVRLQLAGATADGTVTFPAGAEHIVNVASNAGARGNFEATEPPNFGILLAQDFLLVGTVFDDSAGDGQVDAGDGLSAWTVQAYLSNDGDDVLDADEIAAGPAAEALTDGNGNYDLNLTELPLSTVLYIVEIPQTGWAEVPFVRNEADGVLQTTVNMVNATVGSLGYVLGTGGAYLNVNFANSQIVAPPSKRDFVRPIVYGSSPTATTPPTAAAPAAITSVATTSSDPPAAPGTFSSDVVSPSLAASSAAVDFAGAPQPSSQVEAKPAVIPSEPAPSQAATSSQTATAVVATPPAAAAVLVPEIAEPEPASAREVVLSLVRRRTLPLFFADPQDALSGTLLGPAKTSAARELVFAEDAV